MSDWNNLEQTVIKVFGY